MSSLSVPDVGMTIKPPSPQSSTSLRPAIGLTLPDGIIEAMIKCVQAGNPIQLSLSENPSISYGEKMQHLALAKDTRPREVFRTTSSNPIPCDGRATVPHPSPNTFTSIKMTSTLAAMINQTYCPTKSASHGSSPNTAKSSTTAGADAALAALQNSLASESIKKAENTVKYIKDGSLTILGKRGPSKLGSSSSYLNHQRPNNNLKKPSLSPQFASTAVPLSQQQAVQAKVARKPVIHLLAVGPLSEDMLGSKVPDATSRDLKQALEKVGDLNESSGKWELRKTFFKELDVWDFKYERPEDRQRAIDNAVKIFDKMRLNVSEPQWEKLLPRNERATGKCLSRLQAQIAQGSNQKASKPTELSRDTSPASKDDGAHERFTSKKSDVAVSTQASTVKPKKASSAKEAQAKRLASKKPPSAKTTRVKGAAVAPVPKKCPAPAKETKATSRMLSSEYVQSSDDEAAASAEVTQTKAIKRPREQDATAKEAGRPVAKKVRKDVATAQRPTEASQTRVTSTSLSSSSSSKSAKSNSPRKSSPLASSPPTNASELELSTGSQSPGSASRSNIQKRHAPASSVSPSSSTTSRRLRPEVTDLARKYKMYYPKYLQLHEQLTEMGERRDRHLERDLLEMHARLYTMKKEIMAGVIEVS